MRPVTLDEARTFDTFEAARGWAGEHVKGWPAWRIEDVRVTHETQSETVRFQRWLVLLSPQKGRHGWTYAGD